MHQTVIGFCWWDLPAAIILIAVILILIIRDRKLKKVMNDLEDQIEELTEANSAEAVAEAAVE